MDWMLWQHSGWTYGVDRPTIPEPSSAAAEWPQIWGTVLANAQLLSCRPKLKEEACILMTQGSSLMHNLHRHCTHRCCATKFGSQADACTGWLPTPLPITDAATLLGAKPCHSHWPWLSSTVPGWLVFRAGHMPGSCSITHAAMQQPRSCAAAAAATAAAAAASYLCAQLAPECNKASCRLARA